MTHSRDAFLSKNGTDVITAGLTFVGPGGVGAVADLPLVTPNSSVIINTTGKVNIQYGGLVRGTTKVVNTTGSVNVKSAGLYYGTTKIVNTTGQVNVKPFGLFYGTTKIVNTTGAVSIKQGGLYNGATPLVAAASNDLVSQNVGGMKVPINFHKRAADTIANGAIPLSGNATNTAWVMPKDGSLLGMTVYSNTKLSAGHITITAYVGTVASTVIKLNITTNAATHGGYVWQNKDVHAAAAGASISLKLACATATTSTVTGTVFVEL